MKTLRLVAGIVSLSLSGLLAFQIVWLFNPVILPLLKELGQQEKTQWFTLNVAGLTFKGWEILAVEGIAALLSIGLIWMSILAFTHRSPEADQTQSVG